MKSTIVVVAAVLLAAIPACADLLVTWNGAGPDGQTGGSYSADNFDPVGTVSNLTAQAVSTSNGSAMNNDNLGTYAPLMGLTTTITTATSATNYARFDITADTGYLLTVSNVTWNTGRRYTEASPTGNGSYGPPDWSLRYSIDGGAESTVASGTITAGGNYNMAQEESQSVSGVVDVAAGQTVQFRLYMWNANLDAADSGWTVNGLFDNVAINGSVTPVPEPMTLGVLAVGSALVVRRRRK